MYLECCPRFSGQLYSISNASSTMAGILCPLIVELLIAVLGKEAGWQAAFSLFGLGVGIPAVVYFYRNATSEPLNSLNMSFEERECERLIERLTSETQSSFGSSRGDSQQPVHTRGACDVHR